MTVLYERKKRNADRVIRCYLSLDCNGGCEYCSACVSRAPQRVRRQHIPPDVWAEGINRRNRQCLLAGGEPFMYPELGELVNMIKVRSEIYTNLKCSVDGFLSVVKKPLPILASCHPVNEPERAVWLSNARKMIVAGHHVRFHIVKDADWRERLAFIRDNGIKNQVTACSDQRRGVKSRWVENEKHPLVNCRHRIYLYGSDGYRYHCVTKMVLGDETARLERISQSDGDDWTAVSDCRMFGRCVGCDNNIEGKVIQKGE